MEKFEGLSFKEDLLPFIVKNQFKSKLVHVLTPAVDDEDDFQVEIMDILDPDGVKAKKVFMNAYITSQPAYFVQLTSIDKLKQTNFDYQR